jgi:hypothetical protein
MKHIASDRIWPSRCGNLVDLSDWYCPHDDNAVRRITRNQHLNKYPGAVEKPNYGPATIFLSINAAISASP